MSQTAVIGINSKYSHSCLAVRYFREYAKCDIFEFTINDSITDVFSRISSLPHEKLCFSCYIWNIEFVLKLISMLKAVFPEKSIFLGGPEAGYNYENLIKNENITGILYGEGEETIKMLNENVPFSLIPNLIYKNNGKPIQNEFKKFDLEKAVFPYTEQDIKELENKIIYFESSRGCMYNCSYCLSSSEGKTRYFPMDYVKKGLDFFINNRVPLVKFVDRTFNDLSGRCVEIAKYILENNISTKFHFEISPLTITDEFLEICEKMGENLQFELGIQTTNPKTMKAINRVYDTEKVKSTIAKIPKNIHIHLDLIAGLPYETTESFLSGIDYVYKMKPDMLQLGFLKLLHNTSLKKDAEKYGIITENFPPYETIATKFISYADMIKLKNTEKAIDRIYNSGNFKETLSVLESERPSKLFMFIGEKLAEKEKEGPVSRNGLYEFMFNLFGSKIKFALAKDFINANKKSVFPGFLNEEIPDLKERQKELFKNPLYKNKKVKLMKSCGKYFIITDDDIKIV